MTVTSMFRSDTARLTAGDVAGAAFPRTPALRRGYDQDAVDAFLGRVQQELEMLAAERAGLGAEVRRLRDRFVQRDGPAALIGGEGEALAAARQLVAEAQVTADSYVASARDYCARLAGDAAARREEMLAEADRVLADAKAQARDAADAALDEPVPGEAAGQLRAARASDAYGRTLNKAGLSGAIAAAEAAVKILIELRKLNEAGDGIDPVPAETMTAREDHRP